MMELLDDLLDGFNDGLDSVEKLLKKWTKFQRALQEAQKSVIAANADIKGTDETVVPSSAPPRKDDPDSSSFIELELGGDGVYRPKKEKLSSPK